MRKTSPKPNARAIFVAALTVLTLTTTVRALEVSAKSGLAPDIQAAVDTVFAAGGGTVRIPAGRFEITKSVRLSGGVNVMGAGVDKTILNCPSSVCFSMSYRGKRDDGKIRISGINFDSVRTAITLTSIKDFRIDHCEFHNRGYSYFINVGFYKGRPKPSGVIDHCTFYGNSKAYGVHVGPQTWPEGESRIKYMGSADNVFIEDCHFDKPYHAASSFNGSHYVIRHSTFVNSASGIDAHGPGYEDVRGDTEPKQVRGGRCAEIYENTFDGAGWAPIKLRSGGGAIFRNHIKNAKNAIILAVENGAIKATDGKYPALDQIHDMWIWDNKYEGLKYAYEPVYLYGSHGNNAADYIKKDRDYFFRKPSQELDGFTYKPYPYPHPLVTGNPPPLGIEASRLTITPAVPASFAGRLSGCGFGLNLPHNLQAEYQLSFYDISGRRMLRHTNVTTGHYFAVLKQLRFHTTKHLLMIR